MIWLTVGGWCVALAIASYAYNLWLQLQTATATLKSQKMLWEADKKALREARQQYVNLVRAVQDLGERENDS